MSVSLEQKRNNYDALIRIIKNNQDTSWLKTMTKILFGDVPRPGNAETQLSALNIVLLSREVYPPDNISGSKGFKERVVAIDEDNDFETEFCEYNNTLNLNDNDYINIDCNRWISFFKTLRQAVLNIVPTSTSVPRNGTSGSGGRKSSSKRQRRARKTNKNQRSRRKSMKKLHRRK
jgi:hypothetical protein